MNIIPNNTKKVILFMLKNVSNLGYNINQISKLNNISVGSSFKILKELEDNNIITKQTISNGSYYKLDLNNPETIKLCELLLLIEKRESKIKIDFTNCDSATIILSNKNKFYFITNNKDKVKTFCKEQSIKPLYITKDDLIKNLNSNFVIVKGESNLIKLISGDKN